MFGDGSSDHAFGARFDQHTEHREPGFVRQRAERIDSPDLCVEIVHHIHLSRMMEIPSATAKSIDISKIVESTGSFDLRQSAYADDGILSAHG
jgi:hypothetical protein